MRAGAFRRRKRQIQQIVSDPFSLRIYTGMVSKLERRSGEALEALSFTEFLQGPKPVCLASRGG